MASATVVIPTTGADTLRDALTSVQAQTHKDLRYWVVVDGPEYEEAARRITMEFHGAKVMVLPENVGGGGWYGHRTYAAVSYLINTDYLLLLDQDNWMEPNHVESMVGTCEVRNLEWCHSLRRIFDGDGNHLCDDNCESLGRHPAWMNDQVHLVDTSCYCIRRDVAARIGGAWYGKWGQDRVFLATAQHHFPNWTCTGQHTINYRLDGNPGSVTREFFDQGNAVMRQRYPNGFPWHQ